MKKILNVSSSPHLRHPDTTQGIMLDVIIALLPAAVFGCVVFGWRAAAVLLISVLTAVLSELLWNLICKKPQTVFDLSAVVTGLLLGMNLPSKTPLWIAAVGSFVCLMMLYMIDVIASTVNVTWLQDFLYDMSFYSRYYEFTCGIFNLSSVLFYISTAVLFNFFTVRVFEKRRWS